MLDDAGLKSVNIIASNQLNEHVIKTLLKDQDAAMMLSELAPKWLPARQMLRSTEFINSPKLMVYPK
jgi:hypothetical protein